MTILSCGHKSENFTPANFILWKTFSVENQTRGTVYGVVCDECKGEMEALGLLLTEPEVPLWFSGKLADPKAWW